jgi:hypothetical protein
VSIKSQPVQLITTSGSEERLVKRCALGFFRLVREVASHAQEVPGVVIQAASDVRTAWEESSRPNA